MKKPLSLLIMLAMLLSLAVPACAEGNERPGAKWINSDIYGAFEGLGEIRPQDDFAAAVNRAWSESARIPDGQDYTSARLEHDLENIALKIALLHGEQTDDPELTAIAMTGMKLTFLVFPLVGSQMVTGNFFQSIGMPGKSIIMSLSRQLLLLIPFLLILPRYYGINGIWYSMPASDLLSVILGVSLLIPQIKKLKKMA